MQVLDIIPLDALPNIVGHAVPDGYERTALFIIGYSIAHYNTSKLKRKVEALERKIFFMNITQVPAFYLNQSIGNYQKGRTTPFDTIVIHGMGGTLEGTDYWFRNPISRVSAHFGVGSEVHQYVALSNTAYHAGNWKMNQRSVGIEIQNRNRKGEVEVLDSYYTLAGELVYTLCKTLNRFPDRSFIRMHREVSDKPTACPANIDIDRIVREAQSRYESSTTVPAPQVFSAIISPPVIAPDMGVQKVRLKEKVDSANIRDDHSIHANAIGKITSKSAVFYVYREHPSQDGYDWYKICDGMWIAGTTIEAF